MACNKTLGKEIKNVEKAVECLKRSVSEHLLFDSALLIAHKIDTSDLTAGRPGV